MSEVTEEGAEGEAPSADDSGATRGPSYSAAVREPADASAVPPDPYRGLDRNETARIRAQREPDVSPVGTGADQAAPRGVSDANHDTHRRPLEAQPEHMIDRNRRERFGEKGHHSASERGSMVLKPVRAAVA
jgi:hypothetical protein